MNSWNQDPRNMDRKEDKPPYSRIFVVCSKQFHKEDLAGPFEKFGLIEDIYMPRDRNTGESKGVAYIKYSKTSEAATAIQELHLKCIDNGGKPIKVMVATNKNEAHSENEDRYKRLFIKVHREITENEVVDHFSKFGQVESVLLQRDKATQVCKGFGYVQYKTFLETAVAFEECDKKYKPVFATPKDELKRARYSLENENFKSSHSSIHNDTSFLQYNLNNKDSLQPLLKTPSQNYSTVAVTCSPHVSQKHIEALFNVIPGMLSCNYSVNTYNGYCKASINYEDERAAAHAVDRLNNFEFPSGEIVSVKPDHNPLTKVAEDLTSIVNNFKNSVDSGHPNLFHLTAAIAQASSLIKAATSGQIEEFHAKHEIHDPNFCSVPLPSPKPIVSDSKVAQRCFIVCKPHPPPITVLKDVFSRFGDLIDVNTIPNKTFGFVKYASDRAAKDAIKTLNMATVCGIKLKVLLAEEKGEKVKMENDLSENVRDQDLEMDRKRMKLHD